MSEHFFKIGRSIGKGVTPIGNRSGGRSWITRNTYYKVVDLMALSTSETTVSLSWTDSFSATAPYAVYRSTDGVNYTKIGTAIKGASSYSDTGLTTGTLYYYKIRAEQGSNYSPYSNVDSVPTWIAEYRTLYDALTEAPLAQNASAQNYMMWYLKSGGASNVLAKLSCLMPMAAGMANATDALKWWNNPAVSGELKGAVVPTYSITKGFAGNASTGYIDTKWNPSTDANFGRDDNSIGIWMANQRTTNNSYSYGAIKSSSERLFFGVQAGANLIYYSNNSNTQSSAWTKGTNHIISLIRTTSTGFTSYFGKTKIEDETASSVAKLNLNFFLLGYNNNGAGVAELGNDTMGLFYAGSSLSEAELAILVDGFFGMMERLSSTSLFKDLCDGMTVNSDNWESVITNPLNGVVSQNNELIMSAEDLGPSDAFWYNTSVRCKHSFNQGVFYFSLFNGIDPNHTNEPIQGVYISNTQWVGFTYVNATKKARFQIFNSSEVYGVELNYKEFAQVKIVFDYLHNISAYIWTNDAWVQIGNTYNLILGAKKLWMGSYGSRGYYMSLRDCYVSRKSFDFVRPEFQIPIADDARTYGAVPDGTTNTVDHINAALQKGNVVLRDGVYAVGSSILIPSNTTLYIKNAKIRLLDSSFDNVFRNSDPANGNVNVKAIGLGNAVIDGNGVGNNSVDYAIYGGKNINAHSMYKANLFFLGNVNGFEVAYLKCVDKQAYTSCPHRAVSGSIHDLWLSYYTTTQNQDGIQVIVGSHDIEIYNLSGYTGDDFVSAFTSRSTGATLFYPFTDWNVGDVYNVDYHDLKIIRADYHALILIVGDGNKLYNLSYNDVAITYARFLGYFGSPGHRTTAPTVDDFNNIELDNVTIHAISALESAVISFREDCRDVVITNFVNNSGKPDYELLSGDQSDNVTINGVQVT